MTTAKRPAEDRPQDRPTQSLIGAILSVLDDRNLDAALRLLERPRASRDAPSQVQETRCARCVTRGE